MAEQITVYTTGPTCARCTLTKGLTSKAIPFVEIDIRDDEEARSYVVDDLGYSEAPVVVVSDQDHWSGFRPDHIDRIAVTDRRRNTVTTRTATAVIVKASTLTNDGDERTTYYGPFLPHVGGATTSFVATLEQELRESGRYKHWDTSIENVFIAPDESDCEIRATR